MCSSILTFAKKTSAFFALGILLILHSQSAFSQVSGADSVCTGDVVAYSVPAVIGASYSWNVTGDVSASPTNTANSTILWGPAGVGTIVVTVNLPNATQIFHTLNVNIHPKPVPQITSEPYPSCATSSGQGSPVGDEGGNDCEKVCKFSTITYSTPLNAGSTYSWTVTGASSFTGQFTNSVTVTWDGTITGSLIVYETNQWGCVDSATICVEKVDLPTAAFTHQANVCLNSPVNFQNLSTGATSYQWFFGDGGTSTTSAPTFTYTYSTPGTYTITLIAMNDCHCTDTITSTIVVSSLPGPDISCPSTVCAFDNATYSTSASGCIYNWFVTGGAIVGANNLQSVTVAWGPGQMGTIGLIVTGCGGLCSDTTWVYVPIVPTTAVITGPAKVCPGSCEKYYLPKFSGASYTWSLNNGACGTITGDTTCCEEIEICWPNNPMLNCNDTLTVNFWDALLGCGGSAQFVIMARPELKLIGPSLVCANDISTYFAMGGIPVTWSVSPAGPIINPGPSPSTTVNWNGNTGNYLITAVPLNPNSVCNDTVFLNVTVVAPPTMPVITGNATVCPNSTESYCATGSGTIHWIVTGGTPTNAIGNCINVTWGNTPPFIVSAYQEAASNPFCKSDTTVYSINPILAPVIPAIPPVIAACANGTSNVFTTTVYPPGTSYTWSLFPANSGAILSGQGSPSINIEWGNNAPQNVTVTLVVEVCGLSVPGSVVVSLNPAPVINITQIGTLCPGGSVQLQAAGGVSYVWENSSTLNPRTVTAPGFYNVTGTDANGCSANVPYQVQITSGPVANISTANQTAFCLGSPISVTMCALGNPGYTYLWSNGATTQCITVNTPGTFSVVVSDANGCSNNSNSITVSQIVCNGSGNPCNPDAAAFVGFTHSLCNPVSFTNTSIGASNFSWNFGDGNSSGLTNPTHTYAIAGFYLVTLTANVPNTTPPPPFCSLTSTAQIEVPLAADFNYAVACSYDPVCFTDISTFTAGNNITSWNWNFGDANTSNLQNPCHVYSLPGSYVVTLTISNGTCSHTSTQTVVVPPQPTAAFNSSNPNCVNTPVSFTDASFASVNYWNWNFGNGGTSLNQNPNNTYSLPGTYPVTLIVRDIFGCYDTLVQNVTVNLPIVSGNITAFPDTIVCAGTDVLLVAPLCPTCTYLWSNGSTNDSIVVTATGIYTVTITDPNGCSYSTFISIIVHNAPTAQIVGPTKLCVNEFATLSVPNNINWTYNWLSNDPNVNGQTFNSVFVFAGTPGVFNYQVVITDTTTSCSDTTVLHVLTVYGQPAPPTITPFGPTTVCDGDSIILVGSHPDPTVLFKWNTGAITDTIYPTKSGCYTLTVTDTNSCTNFNIFCVTVNPMPYLCSFYEGCYDTCGPFTIPGPVGGTTYQWLLNGVPIPGATSQNYTTSLSGLYSVIVTNSYGCTDTTGVLDLTLYPCDTSSCADLIIDSVYCDAQGNYVVNYSVVNNLATPINEVFFQVLPPNLGLLYAPNMSFVTIPPGGTASLTATIFNGNAGDTLCFRTHVVSNNSAGEMVTCCYSDTVCFVLPPCDEDTTCCFFNHLSDSVWCVVNPVTNALEYHFNIQVTGCGYLQIDYAPANINLSWINPTYINGPTTITGVYSPPAGSPFNLCLTFVMSNSLVAPISYCSDLTICLTQPPCDPSPCCFFNYISDSVWCVVNSAGITEYQFSIQVNGCGNLQVDYFSGNTTVNWISPTFINGLTTITGVHTPGPGAPTPFCLTFVMSTAGSTEPQYCADVTICLTPPPCNPTIDSTCFITHNDSICVGQSVTFTYGGNYPATTYDWQFPFGTPSVASGIGPHTVTYNTPGCHPVILILNNVIPGTIDCVDSICVLPQPIATITQFGNSLQATPAGMSYQWYSQNPNWMIMAGETNQFLNPQTTGFYCVVVTNQQGCADTTCAKFFPVGLDEYETQNWTIYPNPNDGSFTLSFDSSTSETIEIQIFNTLGALVDEHRLDVHPGAQQFLISNQNLVSGVYFIMVNSGNTSCMQKLVVK
jgi:PKD repeat protein